jgi:hypothetical protein
VRTNRVKWSEGELKLRSEFSAEDRLISRIRFGLPRMRIGTVTRSPSTRGVTRATRQRLVIGRRKIAQLKSGRTRI